MHALKNKEDERCVQEGRQQEASSLDGMAGGLNSCTLKLILFLILDIPVLADASLGLDPAIRLAGVEAFELALGLPPLLLPLPLAAQDS